MLVGTHLDLRPDFFCKESWNRERLILASHKSQQKKKEKDENGNEIYCSSKIWSFLPKELVLKILLFQNADFQLLTKREIEKNKFLYTKNEIELFSKEKGVDVYFLSNETNEGVNVLIEALSKEIEVSRRTD